MSSKPYGVFNSTKFALVSTWHNLDYAWQLAKPIILPLALLNAATAFIEDNEALSGNVAFSLIIVLANIAIMVMSAFFVIGWHRLIILGPSKDNRVKLFDIDKSEIQFVLATFGFTICAFLIAALTVVLIMLFSNGPIAWVGWLLGVLFAFFCYTILLRASFYLPGKAVGADVTVGEAISLGEGLVWRLLLATFLASLVFMIPAAIVLSICIGIFAIIMVVFETPVMSFIMMFAISVPSMFVGLLGAAIMVTILSRYFLWAVQNKQA